MYKPCHTVVTLCASYKYITLCNELKYKFKCKGYNVLINNYILQDTIKQQLIINKLNKQNILLSDYIYIINTDNYIYHVIKDDIRYAKLNNIPIYYYMN